MQRSQSNTLGPGQRLAIEGIRESRCISRQGSAIQLRWIPGHSGVEGNEHTGQHAGGAARVMDERRQRENRSNSRGAVQGGSASRRSRQEEHAGPVPAGRKRSPDATTTRGPSEFPTRVGDHGCAGAWVSRVSLLGFSSSLVGMPCLPPF